MMTFRFTCEYNGKDFCGFQRQGSLRTVQLVLEQALTRVFGQDIVVTASGRTDAGVHAVGQVCSFKVDGTIHDINLFKICAAVNAFLPADVSVRDFAEAEETFNARFSAKSKTYVYKCYVSPFRSALRDETHLQLYKQPDVNLMRQAAEMLVGTHNFKAFTREIPNKERAVFSDRFSTEHTPTNCERIVDTCTMSCGSDSAEKMPKNQSKIVKKFPNEQTDKTDFVRTMISIIIEEREDGEIYFYYHGNGFLRNMLRIMTGTLLDVGYSKTSTQQFAEIFHSQNRKAAGQTAAAKGLMLLHVSY
jgi:tRNA pseudouridine38-40 synthase